MKALCQNHREEMQSKVKTDNDELASLKIPEEVMYWYAVGKAFEADGRGPLDEQDCPMCASKAPAATMTKWAEDVAR